MALSKYSGLEQTSKPRVVRCLGPGPEHTFLSYDPTRHRICGKCAFKQPRNISPLLDRIASVVKEDID